MLTLIRIFTGWSHGADASIYLKSHFSSLEKWFPFFSSHLTISLLFKPVQAFWILNLAFISSIFHYCIPLILVATEVKKWLALLHQLWNVYCSIQGTFFTNSLLLKILFLGIWCKFSPTRQRNMSNASNYIRMPFLSFPNTNSECFPNESTFSSNWLNLTWYSRWSTRYLDERVCFN